MKPLSADTTPDAQEKLYELMRNLSRGEKLRLAFELTDSTRKLVIADLKHRFPDADELTIRRKFIARVLAREDVIRAFNFDPVKER